MGGGSGGIVFQEKVTFTLDPQKDEEVTAGHEGRLGREHPRQRGAASGKTQNKRRGL